MPNIDSEQLSIDKSLHIAQDQPLSSLTMAQLLVNILGNDESEIITISPRKYLVQYKKNDKTVHILYRALTYLGNPHPIFKKRSQFPDWFQDYYIETKKEHPEHDVRLIGIYHYEGNIVFVDFKTDTYMNHGLHNSSAHIYTNDLLQGMTYGVFEKVDQNGNTVTAIRKDRFRDYILGIKHHDNNLFELFRQFNCGYPFGIWLYALDAIKKMHQDKWQQWRQTEWAGWFLEYKFDDFIKKNHLEKQMRYVGSSNKGEGELDFDIRFDEADFYGDLKASDISKPEAPGNDQRSLTECIYRYDKFWYVIYEHETLKDKDRAFEATIARNTFLNAQDPTRKNDLMSYANNMKHSVKFKKMYIVELNRINYREALKDFHQGHQPDGSPRAPKFNINKKNIDNFVVFRYTYEGV